VISRHPTLQSSFPANQPTNPSSAPILAPETYRVNPRSLFPAGFEEKRLKLLWPTGRDGFAAKCGGPKEDRSRVGLPAMVWTSRILLMTGRRNASPGNPGPRRSHEEFLDLITDGPRQQLCKEHSLPPRNCPDWTYPKHPSPVRSAALIRRYVTLRDTSTCRRGAPSGIRKGNNQAIITCTQGQKYGVGARNPLEV
jgi:hypothetical protein